jgi:DNA-binding beta-propeller fold protein YncE
VAVDASGVVWVANSGNNSVSAFSGTGVAISPASGYTGGGITAPVAVAVNPK